MTKNEWTEETWNPIVGCSIVSPGCTNCYAMKMAARIEKMNRTGGATGYVNHYDGTTKKVNGNVVWTGKIAAAPKKLFLKPLSKKAPTTWFVNSMGDLFHEDVPDEWIDRIFAVMALTPQHTYQVLTKRAKRMRDYCRTLGRHHSVDRVSLAIKGLVAAGHSAAGVGSWYSLRDGGAFFDNIWLGISAEQQQQADERIPLLLQTPAAVRFISAEPLLGPIELWNMDEGVLRGCAVIEDGHVTPSTPNSPPEGVDTSYPGIDWAIIGGESGHGYRPMAAEWAQSLIGQCTVAGVAVFMKQMAGKKPIPPELMIRQFPELHR